MTDPQGRAHRVRPCEPPQPRQPGRWHKLFVVPRSGEHRVIALGESVTWVWRHWMARRERFELCLEPLGQFCMLCKHQLGREKTGYLPALHGLDQVTMALTSSAWLHSQSLRTADGALRGYTIYAIRLHPRSNGPLRVWLPGDHTDPRRLPAAWDVLAELDVRYRVTDRLDDEEAKNRDRGGADRDFA